MPQIHLPLTIVRVYKLYLLTYLLTYKCILQLGLPVRQSRRHMCPPSVVWLWFDQYSKALNNY